MWVSPGVIAISSGEMRISCRGMSIHFQRISSSIKGISADIIPISAYIKAISAYRKGVHVLFLCCIVFHFGSRIAQEVQKAYTAYKEKGNKKNAPPLMGAPSLIMPANQITRGLACHFSRFPPLIDNLSIKLFFVCFCALCGAFCGFWSMPHAIRV